MEEGGIFTFPDEGSIDEIGGGGMPLRQDNEDANERILRLYLHIFETKSRDREKLRMQIMKLTL